MAKTWEKWFDDVLPDVPGCPQAVAKNAIKHAAIEFCDRSFVFHVDHAAIDAVAAQREYTWSPGANLKVVRPELVWYEKKQLTPVTRDELNDIYEYWPDESGTPVYFVQEKLEKLILVPKPEASSTGAIIAKVSIKPARSATDIDDAIHEKYLEDITHGAKWRLFAMKKKPWSDPTLATAHKAMFDEAIGRAKVAAHKGHVRSRRRVKAYFV